MNKLFICMSHKLTEEQISNFVLAYGATEIIRPSEELATMAANIPARSIMQERRLTAKIIVNEALNAGATHFCITGEPSLVFHATLIALKEGLKVVISTTERVSNELTQSDGFVVKTSTHVRWLEY